MKKEQINILKEVFKEWLQICDMDYDFWIYSGDEWRARGEKVLQGAEVVIAFENQLVDILNYSGVWEIEEELQDLAGGFGYYFEMGNHWNIGFYPLCEEEVISNSTKYREVLRHPRWKSKRQRIILRSGGRCEQCGNKETLLDVHHCYYRYGRLPWQYPDGALLALCRDCHTCRSETELRFRMFMTNLDIGSLEKIRNEYQGKTFKKI